jgi:hypothetical protein
VVCGGNDPALDVMALAAQLFQPLHRLGDGNPWIGAPIEKQERDVGLQNSSDRVALRVLFTNRDNLVGGNVVSLLHNARRKRNLQMGNFRFKIQTEMRLLEIL